MTTHSLATSGRAEGMVNGLTAVGLIFAASVREMIRRKVLVFLGLLCLIPLLLAFVWRAFGAEEIAAAAFFTNLVSSLYLQLLVYIVGMAFGIPTVHSEIQGRTITYLFTRPVNKLWIFTGRLLAVQVTAGGLLALSLVGCFVVMTAGNFSVITMEFIKAYLNHVALVLVATVCITAVCAVFGTAFSKPVVAGLLFSFGWELIVSKFPGNLQTFTINFHIRNLLLDSEDVAAGLLDVLRSLLTSEVEVTALESLGVLALFLIVSTLVGGFVFSRREYVIS